MHNMFHCIGIQGRPLKVSAALSGQKGLAGWGTKDTKAEPKVEAVLQFRFGDQGSNDMKIVHLVPGKKVQGQCVDGPEEWIGTRLTFDLKREGSSTIVTFTQQSWKKHPKLMRYCSTKWAIFLLILESHVEKGKGMPYPKDIDID